jgi:hypothetical protein
VEPYTIITRTQGEPRVFDFAHGIVHNSPLHPMDVFPEAASWNSVEILIDYDNSEIIPYN